VSDDEMVHRSIDGAVATVTLNSPANRNALSAQLRHQLYTQLSKAIADPAVRAIVLTHAGPVFCAGMDLKEAAGTDASSQGVREFPAILELIWTSPTPIIARVAGPARAGGIGLVAVCDLAIAADTATFAFTEVRLGLIPAVVSAPLLHTVSTRAAHELFLTGETFDAARAVEIGLLNRATPSKSLDTEIERILALVLRGAPGALAGIKSLTRSGVNDSLQHQLTILSARSAIYFAGSEGQEGLAAYREKREPVWPALPRPAATAEISR
jgi:methylglutaconyl-CoA hydratase